MAAEAEYPSSLLPEAIIEHNVHHHSIRDIRFNAALLRVAFG
jgi:hypothetical protein